MNSFVYRILCGFFLGISIFAPGVSGSVIAVMMGIYSRLLDIVANPLKDIKKNVKYLFPMGIGAAISFVLFVLVFSMLFEQYPKGTFLLFIGLIGGNLPVVFKDALSGGFRKRYLIGGAAAFAIAVTLGILNAGGRQATAGTLAAIPLVYLGVSGAVAGVCGMLPGMSISMVLMVFSVYEQLMQGAKSLLTMDFAALPKLALFVACFVAAMVAFSRITKYVLKKHRGLAYSMVFGFMCGSLIGIFLKMLNSSGSIHWLLGVLMAAIGLGISLLFMRLSKKFNTEE